MRAPLLLIGAISTAAAAEPGVFDDYFDDQLRSVDIPQESALKACLTNGDATGKKIQTAYDGCFGTDYDFNDLAENDEGKDSDGDDLPDEYEANEACFYSAMGWVSADGKDVSVDTLEADMAGLEEAVAKDFKANAQSCSKWSGDFGGGRRKREAGEDEVVPDLIASGRRSLGWVKSMARKTRSAQKEAKKKGKKNGEKKAKKGKGKKKGTGRKKGGVRNAKKGKGKKTRTGKKNGGVQKGKGKKNGTGTGKNGGVKNVKKGKGKKNRTGKKNGAGKKGKGKNNGTVQKNAGVKKAKEGKGKKNRTSEKNGGQKKEKNGKDKNKNGKDKNKNGKGKNRKSKDGKKGEKKGKQNKGEKGDNGGKGKKGNRTGKNQMDEKIYNKLWCFDLAVEQALEKCVEDKIKN